MLVAISLAAVWLRARLVAISLAVICGRFAQEVVYKRHFTQ
jgi:hypothetical protein